MLDWLGFSQATISFAHAERAGDSPSAYGLRELVGVALDGMFFRTTVLLRWIVLLGFVVAAAGGALGAYAIYSRYVEDTPPGYTSIVVLLVLLSGFIIISLGVVGLYVGRIFDQVKGRPLFVVDEQIDGARAVARSGAREAASQRILSVARPSSQLRHRSSDQAATPIRRNQPCPAHHARR